MMRKYLAFLIAVAGTLCVVGHGIGANAQKPPTQKRKNTVAKRVSTQAVRAKAQSVSSRPPKNLRSVGGWGLSQRNLPSTLSMSSVTGGKLTTAEDEKQNNKKRVATKYSHLLPAWNEPVPEQISSTDSIAKSHIDTYVRKQFVFGSAYKASPTVRKQFQFGGAYKTSTTPHLPSTEDNAY